MLGNVYIKGKSLENSSHLYYIERQWYTFAKRCESFNINNPKNIFIGDSIIDMFCVEDNFDGINFGISGETAFNAKKKVKSLTNLDNKTIIVAYGINDIPRSCEDFRNDYVELINNIKTTGEIFVQSVLPIEEAIYEIYWGTKKTNQQVNEYNEVLKEISSEIHNCTYIDVRSFLTDDYGQLRSDLQMGDGVHLNKNGYSILLKNYSKFLL